MNGDNNSAKDFLLADLKYFQDSFWKNEEIGEKRVTFFITLVAAVLAFLGALAKTDQPPSPEINIFALVVLLTIGIVTLFRILKRNKVSDEYKESMDYIRTIFKKHFDQGKCLVDYLPFGPPGPVRLRKFGGLAHTIAALNSLIFTTLVGLILWPCKLLIVIVAFIMAYGLQYVFINIKEKLANEKLSRRRARE